MRVTIVVDPVIVRESLPYESTCPILDMHRLYDCRQPYINGGLTVIPSFVYSSWFTVVDPMNIQADVTRRVREDNELTDPHHPSGTENRFIIHKNDEMLRVRFPSSAAILVTLTAELFDNILVRGWTYTANYLVNKFGNDYIRGLRTQNPEALKHRTLKP
jgi:hypothetical protein